jgi:hypothetical protein
MYQLFMDGMILMGANPISRAIGGRGWALKIEIFLGPEMAAKVNVFL